MPKGFPRPSTARELWIELVAVVPGFSEYHTTADIEEAERDGAGTFHSVMLPFAQYFGTVRDLLTQEQLLALGSLLNDAVSLEDDLENAVATCFLEHLHQIRGYKSLAPYLNTVAKGKTHA